MSIVLIAVSAVISLMVAYIISQPFLSDPKGVSGAYLDMFSGNLKESYAQSLEDLEQLYRDNTIDEAEYRQQRELLLVDASKFVKES